MNLANLGHGDITRFKTVVSVSRLCVLCKFYGIWYFDKVLLSISGCLGTSYVLIIASLDSECLQDERKISRDDDYVRRWLSREVSQVFNYLL